MIAIVVSVFAIVVSVFTACYYRADREHATVKTSIWNRVKRVLAWLMYGAEGRW